ncbi:MAG: hypothetical protein LBD67_00740, partial [Candidatus Accumulibacter sp.]|nr:hypothetical protein [Accumulibacter sp.]
LFPTLILSSNRFSILTLRQAQGERIEKHGFFRQEAGRTDWGGALQMEHYSRSSFSMPKKGAERLLQGRNFLPYFRGAGGAPPGA